MDGSRSRARVQALHEKLISCLQGACPHNSPTADAAMAASLSKRGTAMHCNGRR
eukprot:CAMPEP_0178619166 /NCGR_PEP_ID=MMETSP0698-20121128/4620_1 /TAXON_ID=265572 /ORGANISM="Extubocellulus spinifer, Strain CCMP396" /LENGTH=53 /DNA_ID=CAMNT_0020258085 /DNA_START=112 /DNA_END=269 /DNA_ORIENTATION=-